MEADSQAAAESGRRVTADSFRLLAARLAKKPVTVAPPLVFKIPDLIPGEAENPVLAALEAVANPPESEPILALSEAVEVEVPAAEEIIDPPVIEIPVAETEPEPRVETRPEVIEPQPVPAEEEPEALVEPEVEVLAAAPAPAEPVEAEEAPRIEKPVTPLADRVVEAMMKTVSDAIYARPSASERAAFLREMALMIEDESGVAPSVQPEPLPAGPAILSDGEDTGDLSQTLAGKLGPSTSLLLKAAPALDPFSKTEKDAIHQPLPAETEDVDEDAGELARSLLDMMSSTAGSALPQERALAADTLLRLVPRIPVRQLVNVVERLALMDAPPQLLVARLIRDKRSEVAGPLLERCMHITDQDLINAAVGHDTTKLRMIARRRIISPALGDRLIEEGDPSVLLTLIRNPGAALSHGAFHRLAEQAALHHALLAPLTTRPDLPAPVAFELFWLVPAELRRFIFSRFLTDSETLNKILKITLSMEGTDAGQLVPAEAKFPARDLIENVINLAVKGRIEDAAGQLAGIGGICQENAMRILSDRDGEPIAVVLKAMGYARGNFSAIVDRLKLSDCGILRIDRNTTELQTLFDTLSFNKARILLTYWDWAAQKSGPYAPQN